VQKSQLIRIGTAAILIVVAVAPMALARELAGAAYDNSIAIDGVTGNQGIRTDPATVVGVGYVHPTQIDVGPLGGDFVAVGTANGAGATGDAGMSSCADDYDPKWTVYADGRSGGLYWCHDYTADAYTTGANPTFQITYSYCSAVSANRWVLKFAGTQRTCVSTGVSNGSEASVFLETTGPSTTDRNIDVKYTNLQVTLTGNINWQNFNANYSFRDPSYVVTSPSGTAINCYSGVLN
jgi:hypothetical protein